MLIPVILNVSPQVGLDKMATEHTRLTYMTTGVLLQKLVQAKSLTEYSHIFVDEVQRFLCNVLCSVSNVFLMAQLKSF